MRTPNELLTVRTLLLACRRVAWRRSFFILLLFVLMSLCHGAVTGNSVFAGGLAPPAQTGAGDDGVPPHAADCAVNIEAAAPSPMGARVAWVGQAVGDPVGFLALDGHAIEPPTAISVCSPGVRRALLQIFLM